MLLIFCQCNQKKQEPIIKKENTIINEEKKNTPLEKQKVLSPDEQRKVDAQRAFQSDLEKFILTNCTPSNEIPLDQITLSLLSDFPHSYHKTKKEDGKSFCIHELKSNNQAICRIIYSRNEGGHYSDIISLWSLNKKTNELRELHLFSVFGKDGYQQEITTEIKGNSFITTEIENSRTKKNVKTVKEWKLFDDGDIGF